eukprot:TRINITY_DN4122_c0_g1_i15.p1 TRINITY_DN4122_c0_g1~~TRINITY_DN4122_c0_g1_i15.p1  ORF type:complete len:201 (-),score=29.82 TRINITY_DN4122_c0_g1_i15:147-749(-)
MSFVFIFVSSQSVCTNEIEQASLLHLQKEKQVEWRYMIGDVPSVGNVSDFEDFSLALINMPAKVTDIDVWAMQLLEVLHPLPLFSKSTKLIAFSPLSVMMTKTRLKEEDIWSHISDTFFELNQNEIDSIVIIDTSPPKYFQETCEKLESCFDSLGCQVQLTSLHQSVEEYYRENKIIPILEHENRVFFFPHYVWSRIWPR